MIRYLSPLLGSLLLLSCTNDDEKSQEKAVTPPSFHLIGRYNDSQAFDEGVAEITAFHKNSQSALVVNAMAKQVDILDLSELENKVLESPLSAGNIEKIAAIDVSEVIPKAGGINSAAVFDDLVAIAVEHENKQAEGFIAFYRLDDEGAPTFVKSLQAGALPDNVVFTKDGKYVLSANEGEPSGDYQVDPEGSVTLVEIKDGNPLDPVQLDFKAFNEGGELHDSLDESVRISYPGATIAEDLEPEYIAVTDDSRKAYVALQENNAYAVIDLEARKITAIQGFGYKDHGLEGNGLDASNKDQAINIRTYANLYGLYMPDTIQSFSAGGVNYLVTANEGDSREYVFESESEAACLATGALEYDDGDCIAWVDETRIGKLTLDPEVFTDETLTEDDKLGRLKALTTQGDANDDGMHKKLYSFGTRSFSIFNADTFERVYDSGSDFETITAERLGQAGFNANNDENGYDNRSDDKGPEPEALAIGIIKGQRYAFVGLERAGGIMMYNITDPEAVTFEGYTVNRDMVVDIEESLSVAGDLGPESITFVDAEYSPTGAALLIVGNEVSGTTTVYHIE